MTAQSYAGSVGIALSASIMNKAQSSYSSLVKGTFIGFRIDSIILLLVSILFLLILLKNINEHKTLE